MTEVERFKQEVSLVDFIVAMGGKINQTKSSNSSSLVDFEDKKLVVSKQNNHYVYFDVNDSKNSGSIIDFYKKNIQNLNFGLIVANLRKFIKGYIPKVQLDNQGLDKAIDYNNYTAIGEKELLGISRERGISLISLKKADIEVDKFGNICFLNFGYEEKTKEFLPCGYEQKLANGGKRNIGQKGVWLTGQGKEQTLYLFESAFDALAYCDVKGSKGLYGSMSGSASEKQFEDLKQLILGREIKTVCLCFDNDEAGKSLTLKAKEKLECLGVKIKIDSPNLAKDWNEELLKNRRTKNNSFSPSM